MEIETVQMKNHFEGSSRAVKLQLDQCIRENRSLQATLEIMERSNKGLQLQAQECKETQMKLESANMILRSRIQDQESESQ